MIKNNLLNVYKYGLETKGFELNFFPSTSI